MTTPPRPGAIDIETWTEEAISSLSAIHISAITSTPSPSPRTLRVPRGTSVTLDIPLDDEHTQAARAELDGDGVRGRDLEKASRAAVKYAYANGGRQIIRRDSQRRRDALLKGKEGSRRRQKWENDRLLGNPYREDPLPSDWDIKPTHPVHSVPYFLAPLYNEREATAALEAKRRARHAAVPEEKRASHVPRELRARLKRAKGAKQMLQDLEEQVREFVIGWDESQRLKMVAAQPAAHANVDVDAETESYTDDEEDEIIFVGRAKQTTQTQMKTMAPAQAQLEKDKMIFGSWEDDNGASFGRWLVHSLAVHYNLRTWSVTHGNPARREAYIGIPEAKAGAEEGGYKIPRPLWVSI